MSSSFPIWYHLLVYEAGGKKERLETVFEGNGAREKAGLATIPAIPAAFL